MTTYSAIPAGDVDPDSPVTTGLITKLRDNPLAIQEGDGSAPQIATAALAGAPWDTADIAAAAIGRSEIANSTTTDAGSGGSDTRIGFVLNDWALFPMIHTSTKGSVVQGHVTDGSSASSPRFSLYDLNAGFTYDVDHRWILAA